MSPADALAAPEVAPTLIGASLRMAAGLAVLGAAAWALLRWRGKLAPGRRPLVVIDRAVLSRGANLVLVGVDGRRLLLGVHPEGVRLLKDLGCEPKHEAAPSFEATLASASTNAKEGRS